MFKNLHVLFPELSAIRLFLYARTGKASLLLFFLAFCPAIVLVNAQISDRARVPEVIPILTEQTITLDALPITIIYEPPGERGQQKFALTEIFTTRTTATSLYSKGQTFAIGGATLFFSVTDAEETKYTYKNETASWEITVSSQEWSTFLPNEFPANGDVIVYYQNPQFVVTYLIGQVIKYPGQSGEIIIFETPRVGQMKPVNIQNWALAWPTVRSLRDGTGIAALLTYEARRELLEIDPFIRLQEQPVFKKVLYFSFAPDRYFGSYTDPFPKDLLDENPERFIRQGTLIYWSRCEGPYNAALKLEEGESSSVTRTHHHASTVTQASDITIKTPISELIPLNITIGFKLSISDKIEWTYSRNRMTSEAHVRAINVTMGGPGLSPCPSGTPTYETIPYFDATFGTYLFPTDVLSNINVVGTIVGPRENELAGQTVIVTSDNPLPGEANRIIGFTDSKGTYKLHLSPGNYSLTVQDSKGKILSKKINFKIPTVFRSPLRIRPVVLRQSAAK